jgi:transcriptional regulator of arginine metabolism
MLKKIRQKAILDILSHRLIPNQSVLQDELTKRNHLVTQATVSRDLTELNLVKDRRGYLIPSDESNGEQHFRFSPLNTLACFVVGMDVVNNLMVVRTIPGSAHQVGSVLEGSEFDTVVGAIASGDKVLVISRSSNDAQLTRQKIKKMMV